jgi:hypothetical protein
MTELDAVHWTFQHFYHMDRANACMHCAPVKFSPLTFRLAEVLTSHWPKDEDVTAELAQVNHAVGQYALDVGR